MSIFEQIKQPKSLRQVDKAVVNDRSSANVALAGKDVLDDEAERWQYFFNSGCGAWFDEIKDVTFTSTFCELSPEEARAIVDHWEARTRLLASFTSNGQADSDECRHAVDDLLQNVLKTLERQGLCKRLDAAIQREKEKSPVGS